MVYTRAILERRIQAALDEDPLIIRCIVEEEYRTEAWREKLTAFFSPYTKVKMPSEPLHIVPVFAIEVCGERREQKAGEVIDALYAKENGDILKSLKAIEAGHQELAAASLYNRCLDFKQQNSTHLL